MPGPTVELTHRLDLIPPHDLHLSRSCKADSLLRAISDYASQYLVPLQYRCLPVAWVLSAFSLGRVQGLPLFTPRVAR